MMHDLDINGFNLQHEYFAPSGRKYPQSNLGFMGFAVEESAEYKALKSAFDLSVAPLTKAIADFEKLPFPARTQDKNATYEANKKKLAELQTKFNSDVQALSQKLGAPVQDRTGQVAGWLKQLNDVAQGFGIGTSGTKNEVYTQTYGSQDGQGTGGGSDTQSNRMLYIILGIVAIGGIGALIYFKTQK